MLTTPGGSSSASKMLRQQQRRERRLLRRLEHDRAAGRQRGRQLPGRHQQRIVPGDDLPDHAHRLAQHHRQRVVGNRQGLALDLAGEPGVVLEAVRGVGHVELRLDDRLAHVAGLGLRQLGGPLPDRLGHLVEQRPPLAPRPLREGPVVEGGARLRHRRADIVRTPPRARSPASIDWPGSPPCASCRCGHRPTGPRSTS